MLEIIRTTGFIRFWRRSGLSEVYCTISSGNYFALSEVCLNVAVVCEKKIFVIVCLFVRLLSSKQAGYCEKYRLLYLVSAITENCPSFVI